MMMMMMMRVGCVCVVCVGGGLSRERCLSRHFCVIAQGRVVCWHPIGAYVAHIRRDSSKVSTEKKNKNKKTLTLNILNAIDVGFPCEWECEWVAQQRRKRLTTTWATSKNKKNTNNENKKTKNAFFIRFHFDRRFSVSVILARLPILWSSCATSAQHLPAMPTLERRKQHQNRTRQRA